jgi:NAD(P)-dependent dehydrogenase (short-subunit alcohol dehydrogenase family)
MCRIDRVSNSNRNKISKLLIVLTARELSSRLGQLHGNNIVVNITNPGFCRTENHREFSGFKLAVESLMEVFLGRSADVGSRMLVAGLTAGNDSQGAYMSDATIRRYVPVIRFIFNSL